MLYLYKLNTGNAQTFEELPKSVESSQDRAILLLAIEGFNEDNQKYLIINPQDYIIKKGDVGYVIAFEKGDLKEAY